jgi:hypothetical protein
MDSEVSSRDILIDGQMLAAFSNLAPEEVDVFRNSVAPDFLPSSLWDLTHIESTALPAWQLIQQKLREAWTKRFPLDLSIELISDIYRYSQQHKFWDQLQQMSNREITRASVPATEVWPFQRAVMFLAVNSWRARFCLRCGKRFVAAKPKSTYCSDDCFKESRKGAKRAWWGEHGEKWREGKQRVTKKQPKKGGK